MHADELFHGFRRTWFADDFLQVLSRQNGGWWEVRRGFVANLKTNLINLNKYSKHFLHYPLEQLQLTGKVPEALRGSYDQPPFTWSKSDQYSWSYLSPQLVGGKAAKTDHGKELLKVLFAPHPTKDAANDALTRWLLYRCRIKAGVPT